MGTRTCIGCGDKFKATDREQCECGECAQPRETTERGVMRPIHGKPEPTQFLPGTPEKVKV